MRRATSGAFMLMLLCTTMLSAERERPLWEPPAIPVGSVASEPSVARDLVPAFGIGRFKVVLEETPLADVGAHFQAAVGHAGDASESVSWVCLHGRDSGGRWALWVESGEIHGGLSGGFLWLRLSSADRLDARCVRVEAASLSLPVPLELGMSVTQVVRQIGPATSQSPKQLLYIHRQALTLVPKSGGLPQPYELWSTMCIRLQSGSIDAVQGWHVTSS
jgi:hypothetical protein